MTPDDAYAAALLAAPPAAPAPAARWKNTALLAGAAVLVALSILGLRHLVADSRPPARQVARIALLPDTPPPPPPPKVEKKEEPPKVDAKPLPQVEAPPKPATPPAPEPLKMEGAAGDGPSAFGAGKVTQDYQGGAPVIGGTGAGSGIDRAQERLYAGTVRQQLHDEIERQLGPDTGEIATQVAVWIARDGRIERWELQGPKGANDDQIDAALRRSADALRLPAPPADTRQPLRFRLSLHAAG